MCVCVCVCICVFAYTHTCECTHMNTHVYVSFIHKFLNVGQLSRALHFGDDEHFLYTEVWSTILTAETWFNSTILHTDTTDTHGSELNG